MGELLLNSSEFILDLRIGRHKSEFVVTIVRVLDHCFMNMMDESLDQPQLL